MSITAASIIAKVSLSGVAEAQAGLLSMGDSADAAHSAMHRGLLFTLTRTNDVEVCMDVLNHQPYHHTVYSEPAPYTACSACERIRKIQEPTDLECSAHT